MRSIYLIGSLRNPLIPPLGVAIRKLGFEVFDDWYSPGPAADDYWKTYSLDRGHTYKEALDGYAAQHVFEFDQYHLDRCNIGVLVHPAGKSCHLELGYMAGQKKPVFIYWPDGEPPKDRWDVMVKFATPTFSFEELAEELAKVSKRIIVDSDGITYESWNEGWLPIETAPIDGTVVWVYVAASDGLSSFQCECAYHPDAGWCADELREVTHWVPMRGVPK